MIYPADKFTAGILILGKPMVQIKFSEGKKGGKNNQLSHDPIDFY